MAGYFSRFFDPPRRPSFFGPEADPEDATSTDDATDAPQPRRPFFSADPALFQWALNSPPQSFGSLAPAAPVGTSPIVPISYGLRAKSPGDKGMITPDGGNDELALSSFGRWIFNSDPNNRAKALNVLRGFMGDQFTDQQRSAVLDQIINNIGDADALEFRSIRPQNGRVELTPKQYGIISNQIEMLSPEYRDKARAAFQKAMESGQMACPQCR